MHNKNRIYYCFDLIICSVVLLTTSVQADTQSVDFSKSYVIPEKSGTNEVTLGGVTTVWDNATYSVNFNLNADYNLVLQGGFIQDSPAEVLEQQLRNTKWQDIYNVNDDNFTTELKIVVVQDGYVGGEIIHSEGVETGGGYLHARVTGDIVTQFQINGQFIDEDSILADTLAKLPLDTLTRHLIRIKRVRGLQFINDADGSSWSQNREYRLILQNNTLVGSVGIPNDTYGEGEATSENGNIALALVK